MEIMCIALKVLLLENTELLYVLLFFYLYIEILAVSGLFKCLIANKCSKNRVETLKIFIHSYNLISFGLNLPLMHQNKVSFLPLPRIIN